MNMKKNNMKETRKPEMTPLNKGKALKTLQVEAKAGMAMPAHYTTKEAAIVVQEGKALLRMPDEDHVLKQGTTFILPAEADHSLKIEEDFKAIVLMALDSEICFHDK
jgi:quercetin dioxygenase-like cupin family protein